MPKRVSAELHEKVQIPLGNIPQHIQKAQKAISESTELCEAIPRVNFTSQALKDERAHTYGRINEIREMMT